MCGHAASILLDGLFLPQNDGGDFRGPPSLIPEDPQWENYVEVQNRIPVVRYFINSVIVTFFTTVGTLITTVLAAFAFSKVNFWGRDLIFSLFVATIMIPEEAILIPNFIAVSKLGWMNHYTGMIIPWTVSVFSIFLLRQFFLSMPEALYKSAKIDGCSDLACCSPWPVVLSKAATTRDNRRREAGRLPRSNPLTPEAKLP